MSQNTTNAAAILRPEQVHDLIVQPLTQESIAFQLSTIARTTSKDYRIPVLTDDPDTSWTPEGTEITPDDAVFDEVNVTPVKVAGLTVVSNELIADSSPEAQKVIGARLVQSLRRKIDAAYFANTTLHGPNGLQSVAASRVYAGATFANVDSFLEAQTTVEKLGAQVTSWVAHPDVALELAKLKRSTDSNEPLLAPDAASPSGRSIAGVPLLTSPDCTGGLVWGVPKAYSFVVLRADTEVTIDKSAFFTSSRTAIKAELRVGFGFPHPKAIVSILKTVAPDPS